MGLTLVSAPAVEAVALSSAKDYLRIDPSDTSNDLTLNLLLSVARGMVENYIERRLITQTWLLTTDFFPGTGGSSRALGKLSGPIRLGAVSVLAGTQYAINIPYPPLQSIVSFQYLNTSGILIPLIAGVNYTLDSESEPGRVIPIWGTFWPYAQIVPNAVQITYICGYGAAQANVPTAAQMAILLLVSMLYENRLPMDVDIPMFIKNLLQPISDKRFAG